MKFVFLYPNDPNPRFIKRMSLTTSKLIETYVLYWDRGINTPFTLPDNVKVIPILLKVSVRKRIKKLLHFPIFLCKALKEIRQIKPQLLHVGNIDMLFTAFLYKIFFDNNIKIIYEIGDLPSFIINDQIGYKEVVRRGLIFIEKMITKKIELLILTSPYFWDAYYSRFIDEDKYFFMPNVPSRELFSNYKKAEPNKKIVIGYVGFIRYKKQILQLIDAVKDHKEAFEILIAGEGPDACEIKTYIQNNNVSDFVKITGAYDYTKDILNIYGKVDIVYSVYDIAYENVKLALPNKLYEAIVCELPIIVAKQTELEKFVVNNGIGWAVDDNRVESLKELLHHLKNNPEDLQTKSAQCRKIKDDYYLEDYNNLLSQKYDFILSTLK